MKSTTGFIVGESERHGFGSGIWFGPLRFRLRFSRPLLIVLALCFFAGSALAQTQPDASTGVLRLRVRPKVNGKEKGLARKRFYLIRGGLDDNRALVAKISDQTFITRDCYYRNAGASELFIKWLKDGDCESVYCRPIEETAVTGSEPVPEFRAAFEASVGEFGSRDLARLWLTNYFESNLRDGFYRQRQVELKGLIGEAERVTATLVISVMTDRNGTAYFTRLTPGTYLITNLLPAEFGDNSNLWTCEVKIKPGDIATERPFLISNTKDKNVKCTGIERPLPTCDAR